jgi:hypothetical protein
MPQPHEEASVGAVIDRAYSGRGVSHRRDYKKFGAKSWLGFKKSRLHSPEPNPVLKIKIRPSSHRGRPEMNSLAF